MSPHQTAATRCGTRQRCVETAARDALGRHPHFRGRLHLFDLNVQDGVLTIRGQVPRFYLKQLLQSVLKGIRGIRRIDNLVGVAGPEYWREAPPPPPPTSESQEESTMIAATVLVDYAAEMREQVCTCCICRQPGGPPCDAIGVDCGVEQHLQQLIDICRSVDSPLIDPYMDRLRDEICADCAFRERPECPCPLKYLLPLAVGAVETVEERRRLLGDRLAWPCDEMPETD
jgi:hypothetical protein